MTFDYFYTKQAYGILDVDNIGNCAIQATTDKGEFYYLVIDTQLGITTTFEYGPICLDIPLLEKTTLCVFNKFNFSDKAIKKTINLFLNTPTREITQAIEISRDDVFNNCIDIIEYVKNLKTFS